MICACNRDPDTSPYPPAVAAQGSVLMRLRGSLLYSFEFRGAAQNIWLSIHAYHFRGAQNQSVCDLVLGCAARNLTFQKSGTDQSEGRPVLRSFGEKRERRSH